MEEFGEKLRGYKFKFNKDKFKKPKEFLEAYENSKIEVISRENYLKFFRLRNRLF